MKATLLTFDILTDWFMQYKERVPDELFEQEHYLGRPADVTDKIVSRRIELIEQFPDFTGKAYSLLDIGCGNGASMFILSQKMRECVGIDIVDDYEHSINDHLTKNNMTNCRFQCVDIEKDISSLREPFDRITSFEVIEHLRDENSVSIFHNLLKDDGLLAISVPNKWWIFETHGAKLPLLPWNRVPFFSWLPRFLHERWANARIYTKSRITGLLERNGFEVLQTEYVMAPMDVLNEGKLKRFLVRNFFKADATKIPFKSTAILVIARKNTAT